MIRGWKKSYPFTCDKSKAGEPMKPQAVIEEMDRVLSGKKEDVIVSTEVGQHQM